MDVSKYARRFYSDSLPSGDAKLGDFSIFNNDLYFYNGSAWLLVANSGSVFPVGGDLFGTTANAEVVGIGGIPVSPTPIQGTLYKILGTTTPGSYIEKFNVSTNSRATYIGAFSGFFKVSASMSFTDGNNQVMAVVVAVDGIPYIPSEVRSTSNVNNRAENVYCQGVVQLNQGQYVEIFIANTISGGGTATVTELNVIIERLN